MVVGGPTTVLDLGGLRIVSDPTFDAPGPHGYLTKTDGPAVTADQLGPVDLVLISHDNHPDNLDDHGRALALAAPLVLTTRSGAGRLGQPAVSLAPWTSHTLGCPDGSELTVTAVPAVHGPEDAERDADGFVNCEVIGFVLSGRDLPTVYVSGDNASIRTVAEIARRTSGIDAVVLHAGAARVRTKFRRPRRPSWIRPWSYRPTTMAGPTSARDAMIWSAPSMTPARARSCGSATTGPGFRSLGQPLSRSRPTDCRN
jgi:L-ascorbate metabolism protein UlaG (beta-lactamase superfamily)